jgi:hypothetical protein
VTGEAPPLDPQVAEAIMEHRFAPVKRLWWRNSDLEFGSVSRLIGSLEERTEDEWLTRGREADDLMALKALAEREEVATRIADARDVRLLWDVCRIPDFRGISHAEHADLLGRIFGFLHDGAACPTTGCRGRSAGSTEPMATSTHCRSGWHISAHGPTWRNAPAGSRTKAIGAGDPCRRRPPVGCAPWRADPEICRPAHQCAPAPVETEGEPCGRGDRQR